MADRLRCDIPVRRPAAVRRLAAAPRFGAARPFVVTRRLGAARLAVAVRVFEVARFADRFVEAARVDRRRPLLFLAAAFRLDFALVAIGFSLAVRFFR